MTQGDEFFVETPARLHFGVLDLRGERGRWFGGIGAAAPAPTTLVSICASQTLQVEGVDAERAAVFARRFMSHHGVRGGARVRVHHALPPHAGLGSGTQLALAVARGLAEVHGIEPDVPQLARAVGRGRRSAIGMWTFAGGGLVVEGGRHAHRGDAGPLLTRLAFPASWRCVVAVPEAASGLSGADEAAAFDRLPAPSDREVERVAHLVLMVLLPALADADIEAFGTALTQMQEATGRWFAPVQGGTFAPGPSEMLVRRMRESGAAGVGQSSWGPAVYGIVAGDSAATRLAEHVREVSPPGCAVYEGPFSAHGARTWFADTRHGASAHHLNRR
jgi:beta-ribofuranosylaminobenzene 5'-phosphate synthase